MNPQTENKTQMVAKAEPTAKLVKIRALQDIEVGTAKEPKWLTKGQVAEVSEEVAAEFCDRTFKGNYAFSGERDNDETRHLTKRAERVTG